jgi:hypothetical protein
MMIMDTPTLQNRINAFVSLGDFLRQLNNDNQSKDIGNNTLVSLENFRNTVQESGVNSWFTPENLKYAISAWAEALELSSLHKWLNPYKEAIEKKGNVSKIAVIMAGNIPLVGMHDFICTLLAGNHFIGKLSSNDTILIPALAAILIQIEPGFAKMISFTEERLNEFDAVIATGSNNTSRYFEYYFSRYPHIIRKNRNSVAVLDGYENDAELDGLATDICSYFGLGCRNVSKVFVPKGFDLLRVLNAFQPYYDSLFNHFKYMNNYTYQKTILQMNLLPFYDSGVAILLESHAYSSPIAVVNFEFYDFMDELTNRLKLDKEQIQCVASHSKYIPGAVSLGSTQKPKLWDYADGIDTLQFLLDL